MPMRRRADGVLSAEPTRLRYFIDTNVLGIIATRTHPLRIGYLALIAAEEFDDRTPSISTIVVDEVKAGLPTLDAGGSTAQQLAAAMRTVLDASDHMDLDDEGQTLASHGLGPMRVTGPHTCLGPVHVLRVLLATVTSEAMAAFWVHVDLNQNRARIHHRSCLRSTTVKLFNDPEHSQWSSGDCGGRSPVEASLASDYCWLQGLLVGVADPPPQVR